VQIKVVRNCIFAVSALLLCGSIASAQGKKGGTAPAASGASQPAAAAAQAPNSNAAFESQMEAFAALDLIAANIAHHVCATDDISYTPTIIIFDQTAFATMQSYQGFLENAELVVGAYKTLITDPTALTSLRDTYHQRSQLPLGTLAQLQNQLNALAELQVQEGELPASSAQQAALAQLQDQQRALTELQAKQRALAEVWGQKESLATVAGPTFGDPISDATGLLSAIAISSNTESAGSITIPDSAMAVALTAALKGEANCKDKSIIYPPLFGSGSLSDVSSASTKSPAVIQSDIQQVDDVRKIAHDEVSARNTKYIADHPAAPATPAIQATGNSPAVSAKPATPGAGDTVLTAALTDVDGLYDGFMNSLLQVNSSTGVVGVASIIQGRQLATLIAGTKDADGAGSVGPAYVLIASVVAAGGTTHVHKTFWTALSTGDKYSYSGGVTVNVALWKWPNKSPTYSKIDRYRSPLMKLNAPSNVTGVKAGDNLN
jgi:hypothetical protein